MFYLTSNQKVYVTEKDGFDHAVFKQKFFLFSMRLPEGYSNSSLLWKIIYFAASRSFSCIVSELEKYV